MKRTMKLLSTIALLTFVINVFGQTENQEKSRSIEYVKLNRYVDGKLFFKNGDVLERTIKYDNPEELKKLEGTIYYNEPGQQARASVSKDDLEAFEIDGHVWKRITHKGDEQFGIMHFDGALQYYSVFRIPTVRETGDYQEQIFVRKFDGEPIADAILTIKYRKTMIGLVSDHEEMVEKINNKEKGYKSFFAFDKVIQEYNKWYAENHPDN
jgi:hypothetical protein